MIQKCKHCRAKLGPWEGEVCLKCCPARSIFSWTVADLGVLVLEREAGPITAYDIRRIILRDYRRNVMPGSISVSLSVDKRFCWAGKSIYGLVRHRLLPGPRNLTDVGGFFLASFGLPVQVAHIAFALNNSGYDFQEHSLRIALRNDARIKWSDRQTCQLAMSDSVRKHFRRMGVAKDNNSLDEAIERSAGLLRRGIAEYRRRLRDLPRAAAGD